VGDSEISVGTSVLIDLIAHGRYERVHTIHILILVCLAGENGWLEACVKMGINMSSSETYAV